MSTKVALVTGGARGIGLAIARKFAASGFNVMVGDLGSTNSRWNYALSSAEDLAKVGSSTDTQIATCQLDVTQQQSCEDAVSHTLEKFGHLDVLVNNAGISGTGQGGMQTPIDDAPIETWDQVLDVNAKGVFLGTKHALPELRKVDGGSIINISSIAGLVGLGRSSGAYAASKGAVRLLTKSTAIQYAKEGIRCNSVHPGWIDTPMTERSLSVPENRGDRISRTPLGRIGTVDDIAYGVLFLASDEASFITGSELVIDGGYTAQ